eukprot:1991048-Lingulodinium_polyedra.AAC.1
MRLLYASAVCCTPAVDGGGIGNGKIGGGDGGYDGNGGGDVDGCRDDGNVMAAVMAPAKLAAVFARSLAP